MDTYMDT